MATAEPFKALALPLALALALYFVLAFAILPFIRRHRTRYASYLPLAPPAFAPASWRTSLADALCRLATPSAWRRPHHARVPSSDDDLFDDDEGEGMVGFAPMEGARREALERRRSVGHDERRLGRELEQGFKDDSEDDETVDHDFTNSFTSNSQNSSSSNTTR